MTQTDEVGPLLEYLRTQSDLRETKREGSATPSLVVAGVPIVDLSDLIPSAALPDPTTIPDLVDFDTETSGLHRDDGAVVTVISLAWREPDGTMYAGAWPFGQGGHPKAFEHGYDAEPFHIGSDQ